MAWTWLISEYSSDAHAFDIDTDHTAQPYIEAACEHTVPPDKTRHLTTPKALCITCLVAVGDTLPVAAWTKP